MKQILTALVLTISMTGAFAADHDPQAIARLLPTAKMSLLEGIDHAERMSNRDPLKPNIAVATSAKFEVDHGQLMLSVYVIPEGLGLQPEQATLTEVVGAASAGLENLQVKVFADKEHIARSAVHMTLFQLSGHTLREVVERALMVKSGTPIDVRNPVVRNYRPVADVIIIDSYNQAQTVTIDLMDGETQVSATQQEFFAPLLRISDFDKFLR
jgi:hypothetical protein